MKIFNILLIVALLLPGINAKAIDTKLIVRVKGKDAKFLGKNIGGALVVIRNSQTGAILSSGYTEGGSGNTALLMDSTRKRGDRLTDDRTAKYEALLNIAEATLVDVEVTAPGHMRNAAIKGSVQLWLLPGKHIDGEGLVIELPGLILSVLSPGLHQILPFVKDGKTIVKVRINLTMLCGCTISKGGVWDSEKIEVTAFLQKDGKPSGEKKMKLEKEDNIFETEFELTAKGSYGIAIHAFDTITKNTGADHVYFFVN